MPARNPPGSRWPAAVLFDLDGTLIDSLPDITAGVAELMASEGLAPFSMDEVRAMVGHGVPTLVEKAFAARNRPLDGAARAEMIARMMAIYPRHLVEKSTMTPGVEAALGFLAERGSRLAVISNKPQQAVETVLAHFGLLTRFSLVLGDRPLAERRPLARKPAPDMLLFVLDAFGIPPEAAMMIGDAGPDIEAGKAAGVFVTGVRGGYPAAPLESYGPDLVLDSLADLPAAIDRLAPRMSEWTTIS